MSSRTAVNAASGARTPMGGVVTGMLVMLCLAVLMPYCAFIPKVMCASYRLQDGIWYKKQKMLLFCEIFCVTYIFFQEYNHLNIFTPARFYICHVPHRISIAKSFSCIHSFLVKLRFLQQFCSYFSRLWLL